MSLVLSSPRNALIAGSLIAVVAVAIAVVWGGADTLGFVSFVLRAVHVLAVIVWVGMIWFVNFVQHPAVVGADDAGRGTLMRLVVPNVT